METEKEKNLKECADYFKKHKSLDRLLVLSRKKIESLGKTSGTMILKNISEEERNALSGLLGKTFIGNTVSVNLKTLEKELSETKFYGVTLKEILEEYFNEKIISSKDKNLRTAELKQSIRENIECSILTDFGQNNRLSIMLLGMSFGEFNKLVQTCIGKSYAPTEENKNFIIKKVYETILPIGKAIRVIDTLGNSTVRLAVLAMDCAGDPHAFDRDRTEGKLLIKALQIENKLYCGEQKKKLSAEEILELYISCGIRPDDISSFTVLYGIRLYNGNKPHAAYDSFIKNNEFYLVSLSNLSTVTRAVPINKTVFAVENQMVFSQLCESCPTASILCTSGQLKTASLLVIDLLCKEDCTLYYNGDFDSEGLSIANRLIERNKNKIRLWHMSDEDYKKSVSSVELNDERLKKLANISNSQLFKTAEAILKTKKAGYQENLIYDLINDMTYSCRLHFT